MAKVTNQYDKVIAYFAAQAKLDPYILKGLLMQESSLNPEAKSKTGVQGLAQITKATAKDPGIGLRTLDGRRVEPLHDVLDAFQAIRFAADYLSALMNRYEGDAELALTAYNEGLGKADKVRKAPDREQAKKEYLDKDAREYFSKVTKWSTAFQESGDFGEGPNMDGVASAPDPSTGALLAQNDTQEQGMADKAPVDYMAFMRDRQLANQGLLREEEPDPPMERGQLLRRDRFIQEEDIESKLDEMFGPEETPNKAAARKAEMEALDAPTFDRPEKEYEAPEGEYIMGDAGEGLVAPGEYDAYTPDPDMDPMMRHLQGEEAASPKEEEQLAKVMDGVVDDITGDKTMHLVMGSLRGGRPKPGQVDQGEFDETLDENVNGLQPFEVIPDIAIPMLKKQEARLMQNGEKPEASVFFAETGAIPMTVDILFDLAKQMGLPESDDADQYAATMMNTYKKAAEHFIERGDEEAVAEAEEIMTNMAVTKPDGTQIETPAEAADKERDLGKRHKLVRGVNAALLGRMA